MTDPKIKNIYSVTDDVPLEGDVNLYTLAIFSPEDGFSKGDKVAAFSIEDYNKIEDMSIELTQKNQEILSACVAYIEQHPKWRLSLQTHKLIGFK